MCRAAERKATAELRQGPGAGKSQTQEQRLVQCAGRTDDAPLALTNPVAYAELFPKTAEQLKAEEEARFAIEQPQAYEEMVRKLKTPEELAAEAEAAFAILHPVEYRQMIVQQRGVDVTEEERVARKAIGLPEGN